MIDYYLLLSDAMMNLLYTDSLIHAKFTKNFIINI